MRLGLLTCAVALASLASSGCAVAPQGQGGRSVTHDVVNYFQREWPLNGSAVVPSDVCQGGCSCVEGGPAAMACDAGTAAASTVWQDDWDQPGCLPHAKGYTDDPPPAVPLEAATPGRFFPVPVRPAFAPATPTTG